MACGAADSCVGWAAFVVACGAADACVGWAGFVVPDGLGCLLDFFSPLSLEESSLPPVFLAETKNIPVLHTELMETHLSSLV